jgi:protein-L-isoaspartate(D-aspartate) O-methyltransferase
LGEASNGFEFRAATPASLGQKHMATSSAETQQERRLAMVNNQIRTGGVVDQQVLAAFLDTPRERFVAPNFVPLAYVDREVPALGAKGRQLLRPLTLARMLQAATVKKGERALDVGGGSGYGAALLAFMGAKVVALESERGAVEAARLELADRPNVIVVGGPLEAGAADLGPFDVIVVEGAFRIWPKALLDLLADGGRLVGIDAIVGASQAALFEKRGEGISRRALFEITADTLDGFQPDVSFAF